MTNPNTELQQEEPSPTESRTVRYINAQDTALIHSTFEEKLPFVIKGEKQNPHQVNVAYLEENFSDLQVTCFNPNSTSEHIQLGDLLGRIKKGEKYRLRADVFLGRRLAEFFDAQFFQTIRKNAITLMDMVLHFLAKKKWAIFLSTPSCKMSNHAHVNSTFVIQLEGTKTWHLAFRKLRDIEHKALYPYDFLAEKRPEEEIELTMHPGDILYLPAYWFHYTDTQDVSLSMHYLFAEPLRYYLSRRILPLFLYEVINRPIGMMKLALSRNNEIGFGDKILWQKTKTPTEIAFLEQNDYS